jgi:hypothetical protein
MRAGIDFATAPPVSEGSRGDIVTTDDDLIAEPTKRSVA